MVTPWSLDNPLSKKFETLALTLVLSGKAAHYIVLYCLYLNKKTSRFTKFEVTIVTNVSKHLKLHIVVPGILFCRLL